MLTNLLSRLPGTKSGTISAARCLASGLLLTMASHAMAELRLPAVLSDHVVLQRDMPVPIWGWAEPGQAVTVYFADQVKQATAGTDGRWRVDLDPMPGNASAKALRIESDGQTLVREDVLVGEVWLCAGQSNMQFGLSHAEDGQAELAQANDHLLRLLRVENHVVPRGEDMVGAWSACSPESAEKFSAVGYYFGVSLRHELGVPVGLIGSAWGATSGESWLPAEALQSDPTFAPILERDRQREADRPGLEAEHEVKMAQWRTERDAAKAAGMPLPEPPKLPMALRPQSQSGSLYDSMILPLAPHAMRGAVWYQGESNVGQGERYQVLLMKLIASWRTTWGQPRFYFGIVQLPNYRPIVNEPGDSDWARLREAQRQAALHTPDAGLAVTIDLGDAEEGHPKNKRDVGDRLARWALSEVYGEPVAGHGPVLEDVKFTQHAAELSFAVGAGSLQSTDGKPLGGFAIAGDDRTWHWAQVELIGPRRLRVGSDHVTDPVAVRYGWADNPPVANLTDDSGLPASPFRTDDWPKP